MNKFRIQSSDKSLGEFSKKTEVIDKSIVEYKDINEVLKKFQKGYTERNLEKVDSFMEELFLDREDISILGTGTGEIALGVEEVKQLVKGDWEYWGDVYIDYEKAHISIEGDVAWISTKGSVKHTFEDTPERYDRYVDFIRSNTEDPNLTPKQKITFINWVLTLNYHQREGEKREYLWPMCLSGVLLKDKGKWKFAQLQFSMAKANFPDERFENSKEYIDSYNKQKNITKGYKNNKITLNIKEFLKSFETEFLARADISKELVSKYFAVDGMPYVIGPENLWYQGIGEIREYFTKSDRFNLSLDIEHSIASKSGEITWVTVMGTLKQHFSEEELIQRSLEEMGNLFQSNLTSKEKLFAVQRSIAYVLKECASGVDYTCPIRMTSVISSGNEGTIFKCIHFSFPFYWIFEGKIDSIQ